MSIELQAFGRYIRDLRVNGGHGSQRELASKMGVANGTIAKVESGTHNPSKETLHKLAEVFNMDYFELEAKQHSIVRSENEMLFDKIKKLNRTQLGIVESIVAEFLGENYRDKGDK